jgi:hypothetical protein
MSGNKHLMSSSYGESLDDYQNAKVLIVGHWKSGTVWLHQLLCDALDLPMLLPGYGTPESFFETGVAKIHALLCPYTRSRGDFLHGVYILRDIRDIVVSMYHYTKTEYYEKSFGPASKSFNNIESFYYDFFLSWFVPHHDWENHPLQYIEAGMPYVRYEDLYDDPQAEMRRLFQRWGVEVSADKIQGVVEQNRMQTMQAKKHHYRSGVATTHFRKGGYGGYKTELPARIHDDVNTRFEGFLRRWGYSVEPPEESTGTQVRVPGASGTLDVAKR